MIPRPENLITKTEKLFLPSISSEDFYFCRIFNETKRIVHRNLENVGRSLEVFNKYKYLLIENRVVDQWIFEGGHDRREYGVTFLKYQDSYDQVMEHIPSFIRMNMVNIDSSELKRYLLKASEQIIQKMEKSVYELVMSKNN